MFDTEQFNTNHSYSVMHSYDECHNENFLIYVMICKSFKICSVFLVLLFKMEARIFDCALLIVILICFHLIIPLYQHNGFIKNPDKEFVMITYLECVGFNKASQCSVNTEGFFTTFFTVFSIKKRVHNILTTRCWQLI